MAYTFFPESVSEIETKLKFPKVNKEEVKRLWSVLNKKYKLKAPINLDPAQYKIINIVRKKKDIDSDDSDDDDDDDSDNEDDDSDSSDDDSDNENERN